MLNISKENVLPNDLLHDFNKNEFCLKNFVVQKTGSQNIKVKIKIAICTLEI